MLSEFPAMAKTQFEVRGVWKADGNEGSMIVDAESQRAAEHIAAARGLLVESALPVMTAHSAAVSVVGAAKGAKVVQAVGAVVMIIGGVAVLTGWRLQNGSYSQQQTGAAVFLLGLPAFVAGFIAYLAARFAVWIKQ